MMRYSWGLLGVALLSLTMTGCGASVEEQGPSTVEHNDDEAQKARLQKLREESMQKSGQAAGAAQ